MALKHAFPSAAGPDPDPAVVDGDDWNADHVVDAGGITMTAATTPPATPAAGKVVLWGRKLAGRGMAALTDENGQSTIIQPFFARNAIAMWRPLGNTTSAPVSNFGIAAPAYAGTATARIVATTNMFTSMKRIGVVSAATAGSTARATAGVLQYWRGNTPGLGGFTFVARFGCSDAATVAGARTFVGLAPTASVGNVDPSTLLNVLGIGTDGTDSNLQIFHNDGSGTATKIDLGANFPDHTLSTDVYELALFCAPNSSEVKYEVTRLNTGDATSGVINSNLPTNTALLCPQFARSNNATALAVGIDVMGLYIETDN